MRTIYLGLLIALIVGISACASSPDPAIKAEQKRERAERQKNNAAKADAELRQSTY